jgi:ABC-2 type transport system permease protein
MMDDLSAVLWKELKEIPQQSRGSRRGGPLSLIVVVGIFGIFMPLQAGLKFLNGGQLMVFVIVPMAMIAAVIADSFAGERERHTLETLLASPLSDRAILFGKLAAAVAYGWGIAMFCLLLALVTVNLKFGQGKLLLFPAAATVSVVLGSLLAGSLVASAGVLVSLRASTVRQAQQVLSMSVLILVFAGIFGLRSLPKEWLAWLGEKFATTGEMTLVFTVAGIALLINLAMLAAAMARFQRSRLILD